MITCSKSLRMTIYIILLVIFSGCATGYQVNGWSGGYSETQLGKNIFNVSFNGNGYTSEERVSDFVLLRSAELTIKSGYKYFMIIQENNKVSKSLYSDPIKIDEFGNTSGGEIYSTSKPSGSTRIILFHKKPISNLHFDATFITESIKKKYKL